MLDEEIKEKVQLYLIKETDFLKVKDNMNEDQLIIFIENAINELCREQKIEINFTQRSTFIRNLVNAVVTIGPLRPLMEDPLITEIMVNGYNQIYIQKEGRITLTDVQFDDNQHLSHTIQKILEGSGSNRRIDESSPYVDFSLDDGSRVNVILPPCSVIGPVMTIRKFKKDIESVEDLLKLKMFDEKIATLLTAAMQAKLNIVFCGSTGAGKTTVLNVFSRHIPSDERIITIEDTPELKLLQKHVVSLLTKTANIEGKGEISIRNLFINSLRMRPDRIIMGEVRGDEMLDLIQSISSGHSGALSIIHAESPEDCFNRMVTLMLMTGLRLNSQEIQKQIAKAIDLIVHIELFKDGRRRITSLTDCIYNDSDNKVILNNIFYFNQSKVIENGEILGNWIMDTRKPSFHKKFDKMLVDLPDGFFMN